MSEGVQLVLWIAGVHVVGFICIAVLLMPSFGEDGGRDSQSDESDGGWGRGGPKTPPVKPLGPRGGIPLPDAVQASVRLRGPGRLADQRRVARRPVREPHRTPTRAPHRMR